MDQCGPPFTGAAPLSEHLVSRLYELSGHHRLFETQVPMSPVDPMLIAGNRKALMASGSSVPLQLNASRPGKLFGRPDVTPRQARGWRFFLAGG